MAAARFLSLTDVAETLNISIAQAYALVRRGDHGPAAVLEGHPAHRDRLRQGARAVVDARKDVAVQVDHQAAEPAFGSPAPEPAEEPP